MKYFVLCLTLLLLSLLTNSALAQGIIKGKVLDAKTMKPIQYANVFLNFTTIGTYVNENGEFTLNNVPMGSSELVISYVGYHYYQQKILVQDSIALKVNVKLTPESRVLNEVTIATRKDDKWKAQLARFNKLFFGKADYSSQCRILNPWSLEFTEKENQVLKAESPAVLTIENMWLGYRLSYQLKRFEVGPSGYIISGVSWFQEFPTEDSKLIKLWEKRRQDAYKGSTRHLFKAILDDRVKEEGFDLYEDKSGLTDIVRISNFLANLNKSIFPFASESHVLKGIDNQSTLQSSKRLEVHYLKKNSPPQIYRNLPVPISWIESKGPIVLNNNGILLNPTQVVVSGAMGESRVSELLPNDYVPSLVEKENTSASPKSSNEIKFLIEKPYVQTDKSYYHQGETVFFKAYINYYAQAYKDSLSKVLYLDLVDANQKIITTKIFPIDKDGTVIGSFPITQRLHGDYQMRAYTRWMLNFDQSFIFKKTIKVLEDQMEPTSKIYPDFSQNLKLAFNKDQYEPGDSVSIKLNALDAYGFLVPANLSIAIVENGFMGDDLETIVKKIPITDSITFDSSPNRKYFPIQYGIDIIGQFFKEGRKPKPKQSRLTFAQEKSEDRFNIDTKEDGRFIILNLQLFDSAKLWVQGVTRKGKKKKGMVAFDSISISPKALPFEPLSAGVEVVKTKRQAVDSNSMRSSTLLQEVTVSASKRQETRGSATHLVADKTISGEELRTDNGDLLSMLQSRVSGLRVVAFMDAHGMPRKVLKFTGVYSFNSTPINQEPLVLVDGRIINSTSGGDGGDTAAEQISNMPTSNIDRIDFMMFGNGAAYGARGANGVISIYTNYLSVPRKNQQEKSDRSGFQLINVQGYAKAKPFQAISNFNTTVEYTTTLYWNPNIITDEKRTALVTFIAPNGNKKYSITIEGVTSEGKAVKASRIISFGKSR